ncbi:MAG: hypothetical protein KIT16_15115 [Rhodospirillaceae bacterium]|nr:hypothetical protein [Rhodospirillaceae bacterium]
MPRVRHIPERVLAETIMRVAESRSLEALGAACRQAIDLFTGSPTVGLYWLNGAVPHLFFAANIPDGLNEDYKTGLGRNDPFVDSILRRGQVVDGRTLLGPHDWPRSQSYDFLRTWGLYYNMCGPLRLEERIVAVFYTGSPDWESPYTADDRARMELLCRAGSLALTNLARDGAVDPRTGPRPGDPRPLLLPLFEKLPPRAADVARLVCRGRSNKEIAREMAISDQTVKDHVANLCRRFGALNRTELAAILQNRLLPVQSDEG